MAATHVARREHQPLEAHRLVAWLAGGFVVLVLAGLSYGLRPVVLLSGSMSPAAPAGSLLVAEHVLAEDVGVGDVVTVERGDVLVTHRVTAIETIEGQRFGRTAGDANVAPDRERVLLDDGLVLRTTAVLPLLGHLLVGPWPLVIAGLLLLAAAAWVVRHRVVARPEVQVSRAAAATPSGADDGALEAVAASNILIDDTTDLDVVEGTTTDGPQDHETTSETMMDVQEQDGAPDREAPHDVAMLPPPALAVVAEPVAAPSPFAEQETDPDAGVEEPEQDQDAALASLPVLPPDVAHHMALVAAGRASGLEPLEHHDAAVAAHDRVAWYLLALLDGDVDAAIASTTSSRAAGGLVLDAWLSDDTGSDSTGSDATAPEPMDAELVAGPMAA